ncbi:cytochrome-c peroxidase [Neotamlana laminarinivorans]|uniref:Cytochrome-c peroxidase n=1 Tax=Neotamlana laminarinivorans TaxID=2883124 RepID=A0A9X1I1V9_9FLAO|nr:cytochrome c peroxidase [Tamlana laminarinivorans]MCB4799068.1 cytochrome-c peroxidase [Tamlana laminarinivorans]
MKNWFLHISVLISLLSCDNESVENYSNSPTLSPLQIPELFQENIINPVIPNDNPQTVEGVALGKKLFFDSVLSGNNTQACATCHMPENAFSDNLAFSLGAEGVSGIRNAMPLFNLAWNYNENFFWDGSVFSLEHQAFVPVTDSLEMKNSWENVVAKLQNDSEYPELFQQAFQTSIIDSALVVQAIAQFERTLISSNSKFDKYLLGETELTSEELEGFNVFMDEERGDCFHCHGSDKNPLWTDNDFHNNGLDETFIDLGLGAVSGDPADNGKFKTPSLRNLAFTAPYMHDGRFATIDEVINHYSEGLKNSSTIDPLMKKVAQGGVGLSETDKTNLKAFLLALTDYEFVTNADFLDL